MAESLHQSSVTTGSTAPSAPCPCLSLLPREPQQPPRSLGSRAGPGGRRVQSSPPETRVGGQYLGQFTLPPSGHVDAPCGRRPRGEGGRAPSRSSFTRLGRRSASRPRCCASPAGAREARGAGLRSVRALAAVPRSAQGRPLPRGSRRGGGAGAGCLIKNPGPSQHRRGHVGATPAGGALSPSRPARPHPKRGAAGGILSSLAAPAAPPPGVVSFPQNNLWKKSFAKKVFLVFRAGPWALGASSGEEARPTSPATHPWPRPPPHLPP